MRTVGDIFDFKADTLTLYQGPLFMGEELLLFDSIENVRIDTLGR